MTNAMQGGLISHAFARAGLRELIDLEAFPADARRNLVRLFTSIEQQLGPASSVRAITDLAAVPMMDLLGYSLVDRRDEPTHSQLIVSAGDRGVPIVVF